MRRYILRRVAAMLATLFFVSVLVFAVIRVLPGDPVLIMLGIEASADAVARLREALGLNQPLPVQYLQWVGRALVGDLGRSIQYDVPVSGLILSRLSVTVPLTVLAGGFMTVAAIPLGVFAATRHRRWGDYLTMTLSQLGVAIPGFWAGLLLILLFSVRLGWVQAGGFDGWEQGVWPAVRSLLLPAAALGLFQFAVLARTTRSAVLEVLREEYVKTARAKGVGEATVLFRHTLSNAMIPIVTVAGIQLGQLMAGSIILESVFYLPGLGRLALGAIAARDLPVVQGVVLFVASMIVVINAAVDVLYGLLDPRIRYE
ncbi:MAG TPA: ABC transporter permease [Methylomirabilota bacterium]|nr:ABC transporter permease [Methylomirabilota bacterium]